MSTRTAPRTSSPLRNTEFRALWIAEAQSVFGDHLTTVALAIMVYQRTESALWAALVYALTFLPALAGGLGLAQLADRFPRRTVLVACAAAQAVLVGLMAIPGTPLLLVGGLLVLARLAGAPANAAQNALTREVFTDDERYLRSQDVRGITTNIAMLVGLASGGFLVLQLGGSAALALDALTFGVSALLVWRRVAWRPAAGAAGEPWFGAIRWVFGQRRLRVLLALSWLVGLAVIPEGLAAPLADQIDAPPTAVGWLLAADPLGFIVGVFVLSRFVSGENRRRAMGVLAIASAATLVAFALEPSLPYALLLLALAGATGAYIITVGATFITWVPNELRGGAGGLYRTGLRVAQGIGVALGGVVAELVGSASVTIALAGVAGVALGIPVALSWARVRAGGVGAPLPAH
ncbi:Predicted arabinose efflux permease, MFS family [Amycolatopsis arida]|uniref:Predicted arabinose efflux permease, MFS family n=1 Tax=Amycolatopsis arida TaxID=587909 RepID=A0A1I5NZN2_9PSEU|nr:MFS transporter [Amycolatopsis arida]TDX98283.1 putative MFS family arabinose efflux permease [Amycolatopsis arida]SFP26731.1 Predicted arabinose efflux permease, MFS family [Amycolatopsis arida]